MTEYQIYFRSLLWLILVFLTLSAMTGNVFFLLDLVNLIFHEAGHVIFSFFGSRIIHVLGGTIGQLMIPSIVGIAFLYQRDYVAMWFMVWWFGLNLVDISEYVADAQVQVLPLLGGDAAGHDWTFILNYFGVLHRELFISSIFFNAGVWLMLGSLFIAGKLLYDRYRRLMKKAEMT